MLPVKDSGIRRYFCPLFGFGAISPVRT